jgi:hypothetical protein
MGHKLSMSARREITKKHAAEYANASKKAKGVMLGQVVATTGWSRANARRALTAARARKGPAKAIKRKPRSATYGYDTLKLLIQVWNLAGRPSGKYLAATMGIWLPKLELHGELDQKRLNDQTRAQLLKVSGATIDRMLKPTRDGGQLVGLSGTRPGPLLRNSIQVRKAGDEHEQAPGFVEADLVLHCGATLQGEFAHSLQAPIRSRPSGAVFLLLRPAERLTDQRQGTRRASRKQESSRHGQDFRIQCGPDRNRLTVVAVTFGPDRGDGFCLGETIGVAHGSILHSAIGVKPNSA